MMMVRISCAYHAITCVKNVLVHHFLTVVNVLHLYFTFYHQPAVMQLVHKLFMTNNLHIPAKNVVIIA